MRTQRLSGCERAQPVLQRKAQAQAARRYDPELVVEWRVPAHHRRACQRTTPWCIAPLPHDCAPAQQNGTLQRVSTSPAVAASGSVATTITSLRGCGYRARSGSCTEPTDDCTPTGSSRPRLSSSSVPARLRSTSATTASAVRSLCGRQRRTRKPRSFRTSTGSSCLHETPISACGTQAVRPQTRGLVTRILRRCANRSQLRANAVATQVVETLASLCQSRSSARCADASSALSANRACRRQHRRLHRRGTSGPGRPSSEEAYSD